MQENMRMKLPAAVPENRDERAEVRVAIGMDTQSDGEAAYVAFWPEPGVPLVLRPEDWLPKPEPVEVRIVLQRCLDPEQEKRATITIRPKPGEVLTFYAEEFVPEATANTLREQLNAVIDERRARQGDVPHQPIAPPPSPLPAEFHTMNVAEASYRLQEALGIPPAGISAAAVEAFRQGHIAAQRGRDASRSSYEESDEVRVRRAAEDLIGELGLFTEGVDWPSVDRFKALASRTRTRGAD